MPTNIPASLLSINQLNRFELDKSTFKPSKKVRRKGLGELTNDEPGRSLTEKTKKPSNQRFNPYEMLTQLFPVNMPAVHEFDKPDLKREHYVAQHVTPVFRYFDLIQKDHRPEYVNKIYIDYMNEQQEINRHMRELLVDWLHSVHTKFELVPQTYYITINILDRFLSKMNVTKRKFQLVGSTCMWMASKFEEIYSPEMNDFVQMSDHAFTADELLRTEKVIFQALGHNLYQPTVFNYIRRFLRIIGASPVLQFVGQMAVELAQQDVRFVKFRPSILAASAILIGIQVVQVNKENIGILYENADLEFDPDDLHTLGCWDDAVEEMTRCCIKDPELKECCKELTDLLAGSSERRFQSVRRKYSAERYFQVSKLNFDIRENEMDEEGDEYMSNSE